LFDNALKYTEKAAELSPKKQTILYQLGGFYIQKQEFKKALEVFKRAYELDTTNENALNYYSIAAIYAGEQKLADSILMEKYGTNLVLDDKFVRAYVDTKQWEKAIKIWETRIKTDPKNTQNLLQFAATYLAAGQRAKSVAVIREVIAIDPTFKEQGEYYIKEIEAGRNP
jgi:tetratricopeptide (TPR) repeat protein